MSWRDSMGPASFRGAAFYVDVSERSGGRRNAVHEFPFKDEAPYVEDLGRRGRSFSVEGYVIGSDYLTARNTLLDALEKGGAGELSHPYHGALRVAVASFRVRESQHEGGWAQFSIEFLETSAEPSKPTTSVDSVSKVTTSAAAAKVASGNEFLAKFTALSRLRDAVTGALRSANLVVSNILNTSAMVGQALADVSTRVTNLAADAASLADEPEELLARQQEMLEALTEGLRTVVGSIRRSTKMLEVYAFDPGTRPSGATASRLVEQINFDATQRLTQRLAIIEASLLLTEQTFDSYDAAVLARTEITDLIDDHFDTISDDTFPVFQQLRTDLCNAIPGTNQDLPRLVQFTPSVTIPSLVLAHTLYGNLDREADLILRNRIKTPGFILGGRALEVLSE